MLINHNKVKRHGKIKVEPRITLNHNTNLFPLQANKGIRGMTREIIVGLVANTEMREQRHEDHAARMLQPEPPCASSTDDVEGIISLFHEVLGTVFGLNEFFAEFPKILNEFTK